TSPTKWSTPSRAMRGRGPRSGPHTNNYSRPAPTSGNPRGWPTRSETTHDSASYVRLHRNERAHHRWHQRNRTRDRDTVPRRGGERSHHGREGAAHGLRPRPSRQDVSTTRPDRLTVYPRIGLGYKHSRRVGQ